MIRKRASAPMAENISVYLTILSVFFREIAIAIFQCLQNDRKCRRSYPGHSASLRWVFAFLLAMSVLEMPRPLTCGRRPRGTREAVTRLETMRNSTDCLELVAFRADMFQIQGRTNTQARCAAGRSAAILYHHQSGDWVAALLSSRSQGD